MPQRAGRARWGGLRRLAGAAGLVGVLLAAPLAGAVAADGDTPDLAAIAITPADLPAGFAASESRAESFLAAADTIVEALDTSPGLAASNASLLERVSGNDREYVAVVLLAPLSAGDQVRFDAELATPSATDQLRAAVGSGSVAALSAPTVGASRIGLRIEAAGGEVVEELVVFRRGPVLAFAGHAWTAGTTVTLGVADVARLLDRRLASVTGVEPPAFRAPGLLVPAITTHIPTPLDVSTDPAVAGTNLVLSALALLLLTVTARLATRMIDDHEERLARLASMGVLGRLRGAVGATRPGTRAGRLGAAAGPIGVALFYGLVFAALDASWEPLSATGIWLVVSLTIACGVVGLGDDLIQWRLARRLGVPAALGVRPSGILAAIGSTAVSRATAVVPGLMFGTPQALRLDERALGPERAARFAVVGTVALAAVGIAAWAATLATSAALRSGGTPLVGGLEALLLLIYAAALQNLFVSLVGFGGTVGDAIRHRSRVGWAGLLLVVTFLFWHTLLNPAGDPAIALASRNVQVILGLVGTFSAVTCGAWIVLRLARPPVAPQPEAPQPEPSMRGRPREGDPVAAPVAAPASAVASPEARIPAVDVGRSGPPAVQAIADPRRAVDPAAAAPQPVSDVLLDSADGRVRGPVLLRFAGDWVTARVVVVDPAATAQLRLFALISGLGVLGSASAYARWLDGREPPAGAIAGLLGVMALWVVALVGARLWAERHRVIHTAEFAATSIERVTVGRNWAATCLLAIVLTPVAALLYLALSQRRIVRIHAPFLVGRDLPVGLRLSTSEDEARRLERIAVTAAMPPPGALA